MKMKKLTTFVACAAMAGVFATSAFAANDAQVARAQDYLNSKGIAYTVTASDVDKAVAAGYTADALGCQGKRSGWIRLSLIPKAQRTRLSMC